MKDYLNEIDSQFPLRQSREDKAAFQAYAVQEAAASGYSAEVTSAHTSGGGGKPGKHGNIVIGDPEKAGAVFTAHYDTPRRALLPNTMIPLNQPLKYAYLFAELAVMLVLAIGAARAVRSWYGRDGAAARLIYVGVYAAVYFGLFMILFRGAANRHNRNDNTSGTAAVLTLAQKLAGNPRAAFILFDNEEKGKKGSRAYAEARPEIRSDRLVVNLDCVGNGETFIASASDKAMEDPRFAALESALRGIGAEICSARRASLNSDQKSFDKGVGICACRYRKGIGYYTPRIHTNRDTVASPENITKLADALAEFAGSL